MIKCPHEVFPLIKIDRHLSPHTAVYHGKQRSGNLNERDTSEISRCNEAGQVPYNSSSKCNDKIIAGYLQPDQCLIKGLYLADVLAWFSGLNQKSVNRIGGIGKTSANSISMMMPDILVTDQNHFVPLEKFPDIMVK